MLLWVALRAWNLFWDPQGDCLRQHDAFLSCDFGLPRTGLSSAVHFGSLDSLHSSSGTSSSSAWALGLKWNGPKPLEPSGPTLIFSYFNLLRIVKSLCLMSCSCPHILISRFFLFFFFFSFFFNFYVSFLCEILMFLGEYTHKSIIPSKAF